MNRSICKVLFLGILFVCFSSHTDRSLNTPIKLKFAIGGHSLSTTTLQPAFLIHFESRDENNIDMKEIELDPMEDFKIDFEGDLFKLPDIE